MKLLKRGSLLMSLGLLAGCAQNTVATVPVCGPIKPVCINKDDTLTEKTASQIEGNNLALGKLCKVNAEKECKKPSKKVAASK